MFRESSIVTYNLCILDYSIGTLTTVEFNFENIWYFTKTFKDFNPKYLKFYHVHPQDTLYLSIKDYECIKGFYLAFNFPINFSVITFNDNKKLNTQSDMITYLYKKKDKMKKIKGSELTIDQLLFLKYLSYKNIIKGQNNVNF